MITSEDYRFYFDRPYEQGYVYFAGSKILKADIFAENGFVHIIDRVVHPLLNAREFLETDKTNESYKLFLEMVYWYYPSFEMNSVATNNQVAVRTGGDIDTLWDLHYSGLIPENRNDDLAFDIQSEKIEVSSWYSTNDYTLVSHNGLIAPTDAAFGAFLNGILTKNSGYPYWPDLKSLPIDIVDLIFQRHFMSEPVYPSNSEYRNFFLEEGRFQQNEDDIIRKEFGSNCTFIGVDSYSPDRVFTSITGPVFCRPKYSWFRLALEYTGLDDQLSLNNDELCFFPIPDYALELDSSMVLTWDDIESFSYSFREYNRLNEGWENLGSSAIRSRIRNHVGMELPNGSANKEFIPTLGGRYIIWNNSENTVQGNLPSTIGFAGSVITTCTPAFMTSHIEKGENYSVSYWFNFDNKSLQTILYGFSGFYNLLVKAGMDDLSFINKQGKYTVFVPSDEALTSYQADTLAIEDLRDLLQLHFIEGSMIFTDNKQPSGEYGTVNGHFLNISTGPDIIEILDQDGNPYISVPEDEKTTNFMASSSSKFYCVVHKIDHVITH